MREFLELAALIVFVVTVTAVLIAGVAHFALVGRFSRHRSEGEGNRRRRREDE